MRKDDAPDRRRIDDRDLAKGRGTPEIALSPSFHTASAGSGLTAVSMATLLLSGHPVVSVAGYALIGAGLAPVVPILFSAATQVPGPSRAAAIAAVSSIGHAGFLIGQPLIGGIAHVASLTAAMSVVVVAAVLLALGARRVS